MFWRLALATCWRLSPVTKNACFAFQRQFLTLFQFFPRMFVTVHCLPHFPLNWNWPKHSSNSIFASFLLKSSPLFSVSLHFPCFEYAFLDFVSVLLPLCFEKYHARSRVCFILVSVHWLRVSVFDFITGVYMKSVVCALFHDCLVSFISCLWYFVTLFVIWILVMLSAHLILSYYCSSSYLIAYSTYYVSVAYDFLFFNLVLLSTIEWNFPVSHSNTWI